MTEFASSNIDFPRATFVKSAIEATTIICGLPSYQKIVNECLIDVPDSMFNMCLCSAAEIYKNGMLATAFDASLDLENPHKRQNQKQKSRVVRKEQIKDCRPAAGGGDSASGFWLVVGQVVCVAVPFGASETVVHWAG